MLSFASLWSNHPNIKGDAPLLDSKMYENQCAINLSASLMRSGEDMRSFRGVRSWDKTKPAYALRAQELANWLTTPAAHLPSKVTKLKGKETFEYIKGKKGIVFFQNYWGPGNQGDHIDLWDGFRLTHYRSIAQIYLRIGSFGLGSDYSAAEAVWFWPVQ